jgi:hypothetical protein
MTPEHAALIQSCRETATLEAENRLFRSLLRELLDAGSDESPARERAERALLSPSVDGRTGRSQP